MHKHPNSYAITTANEVEAVKTEGQEDVKVEEGMSKLRPHIE